jgi:ABC-type branched-subunit amino acid transport system substrate-binding protein
VLLYCKRFPREIAIRIALALLLLVATPTFAADVVRIGYLGAEDTEGNPATAQTKYRKLAAQDNIHVLCGVLLANIGYALVPPIERDRTPSLFFTTPDDLTKRRLTKSLLRSNFAASQPMHALGDYAAKTLRYKRVAAIAMDNAFGHEGIGGFQRVFDDAGGKVVQKIWVPLNVMDFAPFLTQGDEVVGHIGASIWAPTLTNPANRTFMQLAEERFKRTTAPSRTGTGSSPRSGRRSKARRTRGARSSWTSTEIRRRTSAS